MLQRTIEKGLPVDAFGITFLPVEELYDIIKVVGLHALWKTRMGAGYAGVHVKSSRETFIENVGQIKVIYSLSQRIGSLPLM